MTGTEANQVIKRLEAAFEHRFPPETAVEWARSIQHLTLEQAERAIEHCKRNVTKKLTIADFLAAVGDGDSMANASAYTLPDIERTMMAPIHFLADYGVCKAKGCPGLTDPAKCDGTFGGKVPRGCCGWERWMIFRTDRWLKRTGRPYPPKLVRWLAEQEKPQLEDIPALEGETKSA